MRQLYTLGGLLLAACLLLWACSGVRPLRKGETLRCPSCGAEFTVEQGTKAKELHP
jgi:hypothetical protein